MRAFTCPSYVNIAKSKRLLSAIQNGRRIALCFCYRQVLNLVGDYHDTRKCHRVAPFQMADQLCIGGRRKSGPHHEMNFLRVVMLTAKRAMLIRSSTDQNSGSLIFVPSDYQTNLALNWIAEVESGSPFQK